MDGLNLFLLGAIFGLLFGFFMGDVHDNRR